MPVVHGKTSPFAEPACHVFLMWSYNQPGKAPKVVEINPSVSVGVLGTVVHPLQRMTCFTCNYPLVRKNEPGGGGLAVHSFVVAPVFLSGLLGILCPRKGRHCIP